MIRRKFKHCVSCGAELNLRKIEDRRRLVCLGCRRIHYENPLPCAAAFVSNSRRGILLVKRGIEPAKGKWALPSGFIEIDETPQAACLRELKEETGLDGRILRLLGVYSQESMMYRYVLIIGYHVEPAGALSPGSDSIDVRYFLPSELPEIAFPTHREMIEDGVRGRKD